MSVKSVKIAKYLADHGVASRRKSEELVLAGRVKVNGKVQKNVAERVDPLVDRVALDNHLLESADEPIILALHKPRGVVSTVSDPDGKPTVIDQVPEQYKHYRLFPVGRLDEDSEGLILLTNDGAFAYQVTHPQFHIPKTYEVLIEGVLTYNELQRLRTGVPLKDGKTKRAQVRVMDQVSNTQMLEIVLREGRNRQIRRMMQAVNHPVERLKRTKIGPYVLGKLRPGEVRLEKNLLEQMQSEAVDAYSDTKTPAVLE